MENFDTAKAERVWRRVQQTSKEAAVPHSPTELFHSAHSDAAILASLTRRLRGELIQTLAREERAQAARLRGICLYLDGKSPNAPVPSPGTGNPAALLRRCYGNHLRRLAEFEQRAGDADFGPVYRELAKQEQTHCAVLMELLGTAI